MRALPSDRSIAVHWEELVFLEAALLATEETKHLAVPVTAVLDDFQKINQRDLDTRRGLIQSRARASVADANLDDTLREVHANTLHLVPMDRSRKEYQALFPSTLSVLIRHALAKQVVLARELVGRLGLSLFEPGFKAEQQALLDPMISKGEAVLEERKATELERTEGRIEIDTWKEEVNAVRMSVYAELLTLAAKAKHKRSWAEAFFAPAPRTNRRAEVDDDAADDVVVEPESES